MMQPSRVYADHAATTPLAKAAFEAMLPFLRDEFGNPSSIHSWARAPRKAVAEARETIAKCINAESDEIFFTSGGTESDNWVVKGTTGGLMVSAYEHHAVLNAAALKENCDNLERNADHLDDLVERFCDGAENLAERVVYLGTALGLRLPGFISVAFPGHSAEALVHLLDLKGVAVSAGAACDSKNTQVSHVLKAINAPRAIAGSTIRITFGPENTAADVDAVLAALKFALKKQKEV